MSAKGWAMGSVTLPKTLRPPFLEVHGGVSAVCGVVWLLLVLVDLVGLRQSGEPLH